MELRSGWFLTWFDSTVIYVHEEPCKPIHLSYTHFLSLAFALNPHTHGLHFHTHFSSPPNTFGHLFKRSNSSGGGSGGSYGNQNSHNPMQNLSLIHTHFLIPMHAISQYQRWFSILWLVQIVSAEGNTDSRSPRGLRSVNISVLGAIVSGKSL